MTNYVIIPTLSGAEAFYLVELGNLGKVEIGARIMAWPTTGVGILGLRF